MHVELVLHSNLLPELSDEKFFHSVEMFRMLEVSPGMSPIMVIVRDETGIVAHLLAALRRRGSWIPPYLFTQGRVYGEGVYADGADRQMLFSVMLERLSSYLHSRLCFYVEFSDLSQKMFGYKAFRRCGFFPVSWMHIHNSLHSIPPVDRLTGKTLQRIRHAEEGGARVRVAETAEEVKCLHKLLQQYYRFRLHRYMPPQTFFLEMWKNSHSRVYVTMLQKKIIGGAIVIVSGSDAYLWYVATKEKRYPMLRPTLLTVWHVIEQAHCEHLRHVHFMNVGLPFRKNHYRSFILRFGGKPVSCYRWFCFTFGWLNRILSWFFRE